MTDSPHKDREIHTQISDITKINASSSSFDFLKEEPDIYSINDLKKVFDIK